MGASHPTVLRGLLEPAELSLRVAGKVGATALTEGVSDEAPTFFVELACLLVLALAWDSIPTLEGNDPLPHPSGTPTTSIAQ